LPGTVAAAWRAAGRLDADHPPAFAFDDYRYRLSRTGKGAQRLRLHGLATLAEVWLGGVKRLDSESMFVSHDLDIDLNGTATLALCFRSLAPLLAARRSRARWRPRLISPPTLRNVRTALLGHMPGWCPPLQAAGPWRPVELPGDAPLAFDTVDLRPRVEGDDGVVSLTLTFVHPQTTALAAALHCGVARSPIWWHDARTLKGELRVPDAERWWPHTHGAPTLHSVALELGGESFEPGRGGFRSLEVDHGADSEGFPLRVNGFPVFCRGACWTSADLATLAGTPEQLAHAFSLARDAGMNMLRVGGTMVYGSDAFYTLADQYGILIWQDFAFANFDYPNDEAFVASVSREARQFLARARRFATLAVLCGGSEVDQQAAMFGLPPSMRAHDVTIATLRDPANGRTWSQAFHLAERSADERHDPGLTATLETAAGGWQLIVEATRFTRFVRIVDAHFRAAEDWFHLPPNCPRTIPLVPFNADDTEAAPEGEIRGINTGTPVFYG
jgi:beta-mannosidase